MLHSLPQAHEAGGWRYHSEFWVGTQGLTYGLQLVAMLGAIKVMIMVIRDLCPAPSPSCHLLPGSGAGSGSGRGTAFSPFWAFGHLP